VNVNVIRPLPDVPGIEHRYVDTARMRFHVAQAGSGIPILLLHGWPQHWWSWRKVLPLLAQDHLVVCPDLRGAGWSDAPKEGYRTEQLVDDVLALLDTLGLPQVLVVGHDVGGRIGFHLSLRAPERVSALVTLNAMHPYWRARALVGQAWRFWWTPLVETTMVGRWIVRQVPAVTRMVFRLGHSRGVLSPAEIAEYVASTREPDHARAGERLMHEFAYREIVPTLLGRNRSRRLTVPTLMLHGTRNASRTARSLRGYEAYADELNIQMIEGAGQWLPEQCPDIVADAVREFGRRSASTAVSRME
jgi:pimeloyl-ACP methyl ester carboxylesterase